MQRKLSIVCQVLARLCPEPTLAHLLSCLASHASDAEPAAVCGTLEVLRHLVPRLGAERLAGQQTAALLSAVAALLPTAPPRTRLAVVPLVGALGSQGLLEGEAGRPLLLFLLKQAPTLTLALTLTLNP